MYTDEELQTFVFGDSLGFEPKLSDINNQQSAQDIDYNVIAERFVLVDDILLLMVASGKLPYESLAMKEEREKLNLMSVEELRDIKSQWEQDELSSNPSRGVLKF